MFTWLNLVHQKIIDFHLSAPSPTAALSEVQGNNRDLKWPYMSEAVNSPKSGKIF